MPDAYSGPSSTWMYGNRIVFILWSKDQPLAIRILSKELTESFTSHFEALWIIAKE